MNNLIYVADNDLATSRSVQDFLETHNFDVECFKTGEQLYNAYQFKKCALAILSLAMPDKDSFEIGAKIKQQAATPVIVLAPQDTQEDHAFSISLGMDAYLAKPLCLSKLTTYVKALMIKSRWDHGPAPAPPAAADTAPKTYQNILAYGDITVCLNQRVAQHNNTDIGLTGTELKLLTILMEEQHRAIARDELIHKIWGEGSKIGPRATDDIVKRLRKKMATAGSQTTIDTVWGFGFRLRQ
jgi:DNA-binding response OmpR family regulator